MARYFARIIDAQTGGEGAYEFEAADDLMGRTGDEIVNTFLNAVDHDVLHDHADWPAVHRAHHCYQARCHSA
jgi:hypothetical protein